MAEALINLTGQRGVKAIAMSKLETIIATLGVEKSASPFHSFLAPSL